MEKYGVDESAGVDQEKLEKQAAKGCPTCGSKLEKHGSVLKCPSCGTEPFEPPREGGSG
jgi:ribosomal protein S27AE